MVEKKLDMRIIKTHKALCETFITMLDEKKFEDITVNELCERAMVRRATFYKHFADKYDFFSFFIQRMQQEFHAESVTYQQEDAPYLYYVHMYEKVFDFFESHQKMVTHIMNSNMFPTLISLVSDEIYRNFLLTIKEDDKLLANLPISGETLASFYTGGILQTLYQWLQSPKAKSKEELIKEVATLFACFRP